jgi:hypothetical protein
MNAEKTPSDPDPWAPFRWIGAIVIVAVAALAGFLLFSQIQAREDSPRDSSGTGEQLPPPEELNYIVEETNKRLTTSKILAGEVGIEGTRPAARFSIETDHPNSYFESMEYTIETGGANNPAQIICNLIEKIDQGDKSPILEALDRINAEVGISPTGVAFKANGPLRAIVEVLFAIRAVTDVPKKKAQILIRGFADAERSKWEREQETQDYRFNRIMALYPVKEELQSYNQQNFESHRKPIAIPDKYNNSHLPDLRAEFFRRDFVLRMLKSCDMGDRVDVYILKGYAFKKKHDVKERRVDIQVNLF